MMLLKEGNERKICIAVFGRIKVTVPTCRAGSSEWAKSCRSVLANTPEPESGIALIIKTFTALNKESSPLAGGLTTSQALYISRSGCVIHDLRLLMMHPERNKRHYFEFA